MHRGGGHGTGSLRNSWRQQQATRAACEAALLHPTLDARPLLLQAQLAPLFASHGAVLASDCASWADDGTWDGAEDPSECSEAHLRHGGGIGSNRNTADSTNAQPCSRVADGGAEVDQARCKVVSESHRLAVLRHLRGLEGIDGWRALNRAVLHGLLFSAWKSVRAVKECPTVPADDIARDAAWQLSTGAYAFFVQHLGWGDLVGATLQWLPGSPTTCASLVAELMRACPPLIAPLLSHLLLESAAVTFASSTSFHPEAAGVSSPGGGGMCEASSGGGRCSRDHFCNGGGQRDGGSGGDSKGSSVHAAGISRAIQTPVSCLRALLEGGSVAAVATRLKAAGEAGVHVRDPGMRRACLIAVAACTEQCLHVSVLTENHDRGFAAAVAACHALTSLLAALDENGPPNGVTSALPQPGSAICHGSTQTSSQTVLSAPEVRKALRVASLTLQQTNACAMRALQREQQQHLHQRHSPHVDYRKLGPSEAAKCDSSPAKDLFQACCHLRLQLAQSGVDTPPGGPLPGPHAQAATSGPQAVPPPQPPLMDRQTAVPASGDALCGSTQCSWREAMYLQLASSQAPQGSTVSNPSGAASVSRCSLSPGHTGTPTLECTLAEALLRALPGRTRSCAVQVQLLRVLASSSADTSSTNPVSPGTARFRGGGVGARGQTAFLSGDPASASQRVANCSLQHAPVPCSALQMAAVLLSMLRQLAEAPPGMHSVADESIAWGAACAVFASAAADVSVPAQQQALLQLTAQAGVLGKVRGRLQGDAQLQSQAAAALIAVSNRMNQGEKAAVAVFGEEGRQAAEVAQAVLPWACLAPDVTLQRLLRDWALHRRQAPLVRLVMQQLAPLTATPRPAASPHPGRATSPDDNPVTSGTAAAVSKELPSAEGLPHVYGNTKTNGRSSVVSNCGQWLGYPPRLVVCLQDMLDGARHHLLSDSAAPGFLAMASELTAPHGGGQPLVSWPALFRYTVLPALEEATASSQPDRLPAVTADTPDDAMQPQGRQDSPPQSKPGSGAGKLPLSFALQLLVKLLRQHASPQQQQQQQQQHSQLSADTCSGAIADAAGKRDRGVGRSGEGTDGSNSGEVATGVMMALCEHLENRPAVATTATGHMVEAAQLLQPLAAAHLTDPNQGPAARTALERLLRFDWRTRLTMAPVIQAASAATSAHSSNLNVHSLSDVTAGVKAAACSRSQATVLMAVDGHGALRMPVMWELPSPCTSAVASVTTQLQHGTLSSVAGAAEWTRLREVWRQLPDSCVARIVQEALVLCSVRPEAATAFSAFCRALIPEELQVAPSKHCEHQIALVCGVAGAEVSSSAAEAMAGVAAEAAVVVVASPLPLLREALTAAAIRWAPSLTPPEFDSVAREALPAIACAAIAMCGGGPDSDSVAADWHAATHVAALEMWCRALERISDQAALDVMIVHLSAHCNWLTTSSALRANPMPRPDTVRNTHTAEGRERDPLKPGGMMCDAASATVAPAAAESIMAVPAAAAADAAQVQLVAQRAFRDVAHAGARNSHRGLSFGRCQPLLLHLAKVMPCRGPSQPMH